MQFSKYLLAFAFIGPLSAHAEILPNFRAPESWGPVAPPMILESKIAVSTGLGTFESLSNNEGLKGFGHFDAALPGKDFVIDSSKLVAPVPEPSTYALILAGLGLIAMVGHRQRRSR